MITSIAFLILAVSVSAYILVRSTIEVKAMKMMENSFNTVLKAIPELNTPKETNKEGGSEE